MVSSDDAWMFPIGGSVMLVGLYVLFKYLNKDYLNYLFTAYFGLIGIFAVSNVCILGPWCIPFICVAFQVGLSGLFGLVMVE
jgi:Signal peptide peptidase